MTDRQTTDMYKECKCIQTLTFGSVLLKYEIVRVFLYRRPYAKLSMTTVKSTLWILITLPGLGLVDTVRTGRET